MERKLIKQGLGGYTIYLPKKWADRKGLQAGDSVSITETDTELVVRSAVQQKTSITLKAQGDLRTLLTHAYRRGFDSITVRDTQDLKAIEETTQKLLLGFETTATTKNGCTIENIAEPTSEKYEAILNRIFLIIQQTLLLTTEKEFTKLGEVKSYREQMDRYVLFCRRLLIKEKYEHNPILHWELLTFLVHIQHTLHYLYEYAAKHEVKLRKETTQLLIDLLGYYQLLHKAFTKQDINAIHALNEKRKDYHFGACYELLRTAKGDEAVVLSHIREAFRLIQVGSSPVLAQLIDQGLTGHGSRTA